MAAGEFDAIVAEPCAEPLSRIVGEIKSAAGAAGSRIEWRDGQSSVLDRFSERGIAGGTARRRGNGGRVRRAAPYDFPRF